MIDTSSYLVAAFLLSGALAAIAAQAETDARRLWNLVPSLWETAQNVTIAEEIQPQCPPAGALWKPAPGDRSQGVQLNNEQLKVGLWGPAEQLTLSLRKTDVWDRRTHIDDHFPTLAEIREGAFLKANQEEGEMPVRGWLGYLSPKGGRVVGKAWSYPFPIAKDVGQVILCMPDFQGAAPLNAVTRASDGSTRVSLRKDLARAELTYLTMMSQNVIAIRVECSGLTSAPSLRLYRQRDGVPQIDDYPPLDPPESGRKGRLFWVHQRLPADRTFPQGFEYYLVALVSGSEVKIETTDGERRSSPEVTGSAATATLPVQPGGAFTALITVVTTNDGKDLLQLAEDRLLSTEEAGLEGMARDNATWFKRLYELRENGRLFDGSPDLAEKQIPEVFRSWVFAHALASKPDPTRYECDCWNSNLFDTERGYWHGIPCYNEVFSQPLAVLNRTDMLDYYPKLITMWLEASKLNAREVFDLPGMFGPAHGYLPPISPEGPYPHTIYTWEFCMEIPAQVLRVAWDTWDYDGDEVFLKETVYPALRELAIFYAAYVTLEDDGYYHVVPTVSTEHWGWTYRFERNRDGAAALTMFKWTLRRAAEASEIIGVDEGLRGQWREIAEKMAPYPTYPGRNGTLYADMPGVDPLLPELDEDRGYNFFGGVMPTVLGDDINLDSPDEQKETMCRTARAVKGYDPDLMHQSGWINPRVFHLLGKDKDTMYHHWPTAAWWVMDKPLKLDNRDNLIQACLLEPERLVNSRSGRIHLFPCLPDDATIAFRRLQARGGFMISAERRRGETTYLLIESRRNTTCELMNPWPGSKLRLYRNGESAEELEGTALRFQTRKGESIEITRS